MKKFIERHKLVASQSDDPDCQTAALLIKDNKVIIAACNELPYNLGVYRKKFPEKIVRPLKYIYIEHAERKLIAKAAMYGITTNGLTIFMRWFPCIECARVIINAGISKLICDKPDLECVEMQNKWHFKESLEILMASGVEIIYI